MFDEDLDIFFDDFALPVTARGVLYAKGGILDQPQEFITEDGEVMASDTSLLVRTDQLGGLRIGEPIEVDGVRYRVRRDAQKRVDGVFSEVLLLRLGGEIPGPGLTPVGTGNVQSGDVIYPGGELYAG